MAKKNVHVDRAQAKAAKQKKLAIALSGVLVLVLVFEVPKTLKEMNPKAKAPIVTANASAPPTSTPTTAAAPLPAAATGSVPTAAPSAATSLISSVQVTPDEGQLTQFSEFASKDPFDQTVQKGLPTAGTSTTAPAKPSKAKPASTAKTPPAPPPTSAVLSVDGVLMTVAVGTQFPMAAPLFQLDSLTARSAKVSIAGGSYASGAPSLTLTVGKAVTLQNTATGSRYTLLLEPAGTQVPTTTTSTNGLTSTTPSVPTTTTPSIVPAASSGG